MKSNNKFKAFLESMSGYDYNLIKTIKRAYNMICESSNTYKTNNSIITYDAGDFYEIKTSDSELINQIIESAPELMQLLQQNNVQIDAINYIDVTIGLNNIEGKGYRGGTSGSWDEAGEGSYFEDGIDVDISNINVLVSVGDNEYDLDMSNDTNPNLFTWASETIANDDNINNDLLNDFEENLNDRY